MTCVLVIVGAVLGLFLVAAVIPGGRARDRDRDE